MTAYEYVPAPMLPPVDDEVSVAVLDRVVTAAGFTLTVRLAEDDEIERGRILEDLLDLA